MTAGEDSPIGPRAKGGRHLQAQRSGASGAAVATSGSGASNQGEAGRISGSTSPGDKLDGPGIGIMLTHTQVEHVIGASINSGPPSMAVLLAGLHEGQAVSRKSLENRYRREIAEGRLSQSLLRGLFVLSFLVDGKERGLSNIAERLDMSSSSAHRYVNTLLAFGLVEQDRSTRKYRLAGGWAVPPTQKSSGRAPLR
jgi:IclR helix-turn-helix domain